MTDLELIELAAKAAGIEHAMFYDAYPEDGFPTAYAKTSKRTYWNPLTDDGDALRLAVRLDILRLNSILAQYIDEEQRHNDRPTATRRAIVRIAADMGKAMS